MATWMIFIDGIILGAAVAFLVVGIVLTTGRMKK